jgi:hypothetical protein
MHSHEFLIVSSQQFKETYYLQSTLGLFVVIVLRGLVEDWLRIG